MRDDLAGMPPEQPIEWYMARDGQQYGPLSDMEMKKFTELGHLRADDLVWRKGFPDWTPAGEVFGIADKSA
jgi:GYF domain 2